MSDRFERLLVRGSGAAIFATAIVAGVRTQPPARLPGWALHSHVVYVLALVLAVVVLLCVMLTLAVQTIVRGRVPTALSREGVVWPEDPTRTTRQALATLQGQVDQVVVDVAEIAERAVLR